MSKYKPIKNRAGTRYGRLVAQTLHHKNKWGDACWLCLCDCGNETIVSGSSLTAGATQSCGCLAREKQIAASTKHGCHNTTEYRIWSNIKTRCFNPNNRAYKNYGGRGIAMCPEWRDNFAAFLDCVGKRPNSNYTLDRIDNDGDYEPTNCRWATTEEQQNNRRGTLKININGDTRSVSQWAKRLKVTPDKIRYRIWKGNSPEDVVREIIATKVGVTTSL